MKKAIEDEEYIGWMFMLGEYLRGQRDRMHLFNPEFKCFTYNACLRWVSHSHALYVVELYGMSV
jgi:hypothetical protein